MCKTCQFSSQNKDPCVIKESEEEVHIHNATVFAVYIRNWLGKSRDHV